MLGKNVGFQRTPCFSLGFWSVFAGVLESACFLGTPFLCAGGGVGVFAEGVLENACVLGTPFFVSATKRVSTYVHYRGVLKNAFC